MPQAELEKEADCLQLASLLSAGDLKGAGACLTRDACLLTPDATAVHGRDSVRWVLAQLIAGKIRIEVECRRILIAGDAGVSRERWAVSRSGVNDRPVTTLLHPTLCLQQIEGTWKVAVLVLWGWGSGLEG